MGLELNHPYWLLNPCGEREAGGGRGGGGKSIPVNNETKTRFYGRPLPQMYLPVA